MYLINQYNHDWEKITSKMNARTKVECMRRYTSLSTKKKSKHWTLEDNIKMAQLFKEFGENWGRIASEFNETSR